MCGSTIVVVLVVAYDQKMAGSRSRTAVPTQPRAFARSSSTARASGAYYSRPIALRHPIVFYEGHLPAFSFNTLVKKALGGPSIDPRLETLFARGIDPHESRVRGPPTAGSQRGVARLATRCARSPPKPIARVLDALAREDLDRPGHPLLDRAEAVFTILEHEAMHQETLLYMWHRLPFDESAGRTATRRWSTGTVRPPRNGSTIPAGRATLGVDRDAVPFGWDNEFPAVRRRRAGVLDRAPQRDQRAIPGVRRAGGYTDSGGGRAEDWQWMRERARRAPVVLGASDTRLVWRGMFDCCRCRCRGRCTSATRRPRRTRDGAAPRLPTEAEYQRAAFGHAGRRERRYPWGEAAPTAEHGVFDFSAGIPSPAGSHPAGASAWGVEDLAGNGWEWTSTPFAPFPGFRPMASYPEYSADFFDGEHFVMKGASPATARELLRPTLPQLVPGRYPYVYATFRCVK